MLRMNVEANNAFAAGQAPTAPPPPPPPPPPAQAGATTAPFPPQMQPQSRSERPLDVDKTTAEGAPQLSADSLSAVSGGSFPAALPSCATDPEPLRNLIVNYLPPLMDELQLCALFGQFGPIESVKIIYDKETKESRGYGFVKYLHFFSASYAMNALNGFCIAGKRLKVAYANVGAAWEAYRALRASSMMFSMTQQAALQNVFYQQMMLAQQ